MVEEAEALLHILLILFTAKVLEEVMYRLHQPLVLGDILAGIILGPTVLGLIVIPEHVKAIAWLGLVVLVFLAGFESEISEFKRYGRPAAIVALGGVVVSFTLGYLYGVFLGYDQASSLFLAAILTPTSVGVTIGTLSSIGRLHSREGYIILGAAVIDDVYAVIVLSIVYGLAMGSTQLEAYASIVAGILVLILILLLVPRSTDRLYNLFRKLHVHEAPFIFTFIIGLAVAVFSAYVGLTPIPGAFIIGLALSGIKAPERIRRDLEVLEEVITPIFFAYAGILLNPWELENAIQVLPVATGITILGLVGKVLGCSLASRTAGLDWYESLIVGFGMMPRAGVDIVIAVTGLTLGIIDQAIYMGALMLVYVSSILTPIIVQYIHNKRSLRQGGSA